ncbi:hypothetical protein EJG09_06810 [Neisseria meningitidis]|nr:hypothetical protein [Neisseria meningitidis]
MGAETYTPSFPRTRESSNRKTTGIYRKTETLDRHSRERGNPVTEKPRESIGKNRNPRPSFPRTRESRT